VDDAGVERPRAPLAPLLLGQVVVEAAREGQDERHDVGGNVIVVDFPEVGDHQRVGDEVGIVVAGGRRRLRRLQPTERACPLQERGGERTEGRVGLPDLSRRVGLVAGDDDAKRGKRRAEAGGPVIGGGRRKREHDQGGHGGGDCSTRAGCSGNSHVAQNVGKEARRRARSGGCSP
jgi:hypothetical protein